MHQSPLPAAANCGILAAAGVPAGVLLAPVIHGLTDHEMPAILNASKSSSVSFASYVMLRLSLAVGLSFDDWLEWYRPDQKGKVLSRIRQIHGSSREDADRLYDARFGSRMRISSPFAELVATMFARACAHAGVSKRTPVFDFGSFRVLEGYRAGAEQLTL